MPAVGHRVLTLKLFAACVIIAIAGPAVTAASRALLDESNQLSITATADRQTPPGGTGGDVQPEAVDVGAAAVSLDPPGLLPATEDAQVTSEESVASSISADVQPSADTVSASASLPATPLETPVTTVQSSGPAVADAAVDAANSTTTLSDDVPDPGDGSNVQAAGFTCSINDGSTRPVQLDLEFIQAWYGGCLTVNSMYIQNSQLKLAQCSTGKLQQRWNSVNKGNWSLIKATYNPNSMGGSASRNKCMTMRTSGGLSGALVVIRTCTNELSQQWGVDSWNRLRPAVAPHMCVTYCESRLEMWPCGCSDANQRFYKWFGGRRCPWW